MEKYIFEMYPLVVNKYIWQYDDRCCKVYKKTSDNKFNIQCEYSVVLSETYIEEPSQTLIVLTGAPYEI